LLPPPTKRGDGGDDACYSDADARRRPCCHRRRPTKRCCCATVFALSLLANAAVAVVAAVIFLGHGKGSSAPPPNPVPPGPRNTTNATDLQCLVMASSGGYAVVDSGRPSPDGRQLRLLFADPATGAAQQLAASNETVSLLADNYWEKRTTLEKFYVGQAQNIVLEDVLPASNFLPAVPTHFQACAGDTAGGGKCLPVFAFALAERGACGNAVDVAVHRDKRATLKAGIQSCMIHHPFSDAAATACMHTTLGLSDGCASCWIAEGHCTISGCPMCILSPTGSTCQACSKEKCFGACVVCSGLPEWAFPG
jgi:hypothetical protein